MSKFHLTPKGQARQCSAKTPESCKYSQEAGETVAHYETKEEAQQAYEKQGKEEHGTTNTLTKKKTQEEQITNTTKNEFETPINDNSDTPYKGVNVIEDEIKFNGETYTRIDENNHMDQPYAIRVQVGKELTEEEAEHISQLFGYEYAKTGGERGNGFEQDSPNSIIVYADTTKGRAYQHLGEFMEELPNTLENGTPVRKTDRAGAGTKGTRLVDGMDDLGYVELYSDNTFSFDKN